MNRPFAPLPRPSLQVLVALVLLACQSVFAQTPGVYRELWLGLTGTGLAGLTNTTSNPDWPDHPDPAFTKVYPTFETETGTGMVNYGQRLRAYLVPSVTGPYTFWIASDDNSALFLSTDETPVHARLISWVANWTGSREWTKEANQQSSAISLQAGKRYYIEAIMQQGSGGDDLAVGWRPPNGTQTDVITGANLQVDSFPSIKTQPASVTVTEGANAVFEVGVDNFYLPAFQWQRGGASILGETNATLTLSNVSVADSGAIFTCLITNVLGSTNTAPAGLTVLTDYTLPVLLGAVNPTATNIQVSYSKPVDPSTATNPANYTVSPGILAFGASMLTPESTLLRVSALALGSNYTVTVNGIRDLSSRANVIATNSQAAFVAKDFVPLDIGSPSLPGYSVLQTNGIDVYGAGTDIGGTTDQFQYDYQLRTGDFDVEVRVLSLTQSDPWAKAGLMARETLDPGSRFAATFATPSLAGCFFESRLDPVATATSSGSLSVNYPLTWLRLQRAGNQFTGYASLDGNTWTQLGTASLAVNSVYLGYAVASHSPGVTARAQFRGFGPVIGGSMGAVTPPGEPLGPCSRRTGLVISEVMYKPAPRTDGQNLEFVELYNSNPWWEDISGYYIAGDINFVFPANTILPGGAFLVVAASPSSMQTVFGISNVTGPYSGSLKKTGLIQLTDNQGAVLLEIPYSNQPPWPVAADGTGHSIVLSRPSYGQADGRAWAISDVTGGSPGGPEAFRPSPLRSVVINEILAHTEDPTVPDYVELYNHSNQTNDLSGCILTDDPATNKFVFPAGTRIPPRGFLVFDQTQLGFGLKGGGDSVFFRNPDGTRVLDAVRFEAQADGVSFGRWPNGAADFYPLASRSPGSANGRILLGDIAINELMYKPISENDDDQYLELYNRSTNSVDLGGWTFTAGINYVFPFNTVLAPDGYLVVARNRTNLFARYANLNTGNTVGDYAGKLPHKGGRVALARPEPLTGTNSQGVLVTNTIYVVVDEVTFSAGGRWGQWAAGGGSSLELINPNTNHRLASNWGDSDETSKGVWTNLEYSGVLDLGANYNSSLVDFVQVGLLDVGECLLDNIEVRPGLTGPNYVANPGFETGLTNWEMQGDHVRSSVEANGGYASAHSLHLRSSDGMFNLFNSAQGALTNTSLTAGQTATLRLKARWLRGWPEVLMRLRGNWLELTGAIPIPTNLGTPGQRNSRAVLNPAPAIYEVTHSPPIPAANQPVVVTARFHHTNAFAATLLYRVDTGVTPSPSYTSVTMLDDGAGNDAVAGDGLYSATIPAQPGGTVVAFLVRARGPGNSTNTFPADLKDNSGLPRECVVMFGDAVPAGTFGHYHVWLTQNWINRWASLGGVSNEGHDGTFVDGGGRVIYNWTGRFAGSPAHQYLGSPVSTLGGQHWTMPEDDQFLGSASFNKQHLPGNGPLDDPTLQREQTSFWMARQLGLPWNYRRFYILYVNGTRHGPLMEDSQVPGSDLLKQRWPNDNNGWLYKNMVEFEGDTTIQPNGYLNVAGVSSCTLNEYTTTVNGVPNQHKLARYRWCYWIRQYPDSANNFTNLYGLMDTANIPISSPAYYPSMEAALDTEEWMRMSAIEHATGDWDSFITQSSWNMYCYKPTQGKWALLKWDWNITLGVGGYSWPADGSSLFALSTADPIMMAFQTYPPYRRAYLRALKDIANLAMNNARVDPVLDAKYAAFAANGLATIPYTITVAEPGADGVKNWIGTMHNSILAALASQGVANVPFAVNGPATFSTGNNLVTLAGTAPVEVKTVIVDGTAYPLTWPSVTGWRLTLALRAATNILQVRALDLNGNLLTNFSAALTVIYTNQIPPLERGVVINEIMYHPAATKAQYLEVYNPSSYFTFDLSNWRIDELGYVFPMNTFLGPGKFLVLAQDRAGFAAAYGSAVSVLDVFGGSLSQEGQTLTLLAPSGGAGPERMVDQVTYASASPWPAEANGGGFSLQLIDSSQDHQRVANWFGGSSAPDGWSFAAAEGVATGTNLFVFPDAPCDLYLDDIALVPSAGPLAGLNVIQNGDFESALSGPWIVPTNMAASTITSDFKHSGNSSLHLISTSPGNSLSKILVQWLPAGVTNAPGFLSFWYRPGAAGSNLSARLFPGSGIVVKTGIQGGAGDPGAFTPGATNAQQYPLTPFPALWLNEIQPANVAGPTNRLGQHAPWVELYNGGSNAINLAGCYLANNYSNLTQWAFPTNTVIGPGQFLVVWLDGNALASTSSELHASFTVPAGTGSVALARAPSNVSPTLLDYLNYAVAVADYSYGDYPDGRVVGRRLFAHATAGAANNPAGPPVAVFINEWMASNTRTLLNPADNNYDDWFELYNAGTNMADLSGCFLTHSAATPFEFLIPGGCTIPPHGHLLVWADKLPAANTNPAAALHASFHLSASGGFVGLAGPDGAPIDSVSFGSQLSDLSQGRCPDGGLNLLFLSVASPGAANLCPANTPPILARIADQTVYPGQTLAFTASATDAEAPPQGLSFSLGANAPAGSAIDASGGQFTWPLAAAQPPGANLVTVTVTDTGVPPLSASQTFTVTVMAPLQIGTIVRNGGQVTLGWATAQGKWYRVQYRDDLGAGGWLTLGSDIQAATTTTTLTLGLAGPSQRFYRILAVN